MKLEPPSAIEANLDGIIGLTHNFSGLSYGNIASQNNASEKSNPKKAVLQGLKKMKTLADMGFTQGVLPPHYRPHIPTLKAIGFDDVSSEKIIEKAWRTAPEIFKQCISASAMWTANAATVSPSADTIDNKVHFTAANLSSLFHRSIESEFTYKVLKKIFANQSHFKHHLPLPSSPHFSDEGAANHTRLCESYADTGLEVFVYGRKSFSTIGKTPNKYPARQSYEAGQAIGRMHQLKPNCQFMLQQNPEAIDAGAFHNDVVAVGNQNILFYHEKAFLSPQSLKPLAKQYQEISRGNLTLIEVLESQVSLKEAVKTYLFNSQLLSLPNDDRQQVIVAPRECYESKIVSKYLSELVNKKCGISKIVYVDLKESMQNGGGPACLRLRVALSKKELESIQARVFLDEELYQDLIAWANRHYRDCLSEEDLGDPLLIQESNTALDELTQILRLGSIYPFQI